jgi:hypothetical protein
MKHVYKKNYILILLLLGLVALYIILYKIYMPRVNAFGCFDDCNNFLGGYFLLHGKKLFSEIFFNHNPLMAYISLIIQFFTHPQNLYELILRHRQALLLFSFLFNVLLVVRFGISAFAFALFYELTKFYLFGDRFLAEGFIVYPFVYLVGLAWYKLQKKSLTLFDYTASGVFVWFIIFMREPYVPAALLLFLYLLLSFVNENFLMFRNSLRSNSLTIKKHYSLTSFMNWIRHNKNLVYSFGIFLALSLLTVFLHDVREFYFNIVTANAGLISSEVNNLGVMGLGLLKVFFYPIFLFFGGEWGHFRYILLGLDSLFIIGIGMLLYKKQWKVVLSLLLILGLLNIRHVEPGKAFYSAFHLLCWYAIFIFTSFLVLGKVHKINKKLSFVMMFFYAGILLFHIISPTSFLHGKPDPHYELITNYGIPMQVGTVINALSKPTDTLFVDGFDDVIYWQAQRFSSYKYSWYTSLMPYHKKYTDERLAMFKQLPPDFYYGSCPKEKTQNYLLPSFVRNSYVRLYSDSEPSCVWIKKTKLSFITKEQWKKAEENLYGLKK